MRFLIITLIIFGLFNFCSTRTTRPELDFANKMAKAGLWKEAYFRWQKILPRQKDNAAIHNNMAVALEQMGKIDEAEKEYQLALKLAPGNTYIQKNYNKFKDNQNRVDKEEDEGKKEKKKKRKVEK